jgi:Ca-activated chloride channel family protein
VSFQSPLNLLALAIVPVAICAYVVAARRRDRTAARFASPALMPNVVNRAPRWRRHVPPALFLLAVAALTVGFARPEVEISVPRENATIMLAIDSSRSMAAKDVTPTRMDAARTAIEQFLAKAPGSYRIGLVTFASDSRVVAAPTHDRELVTQALAQVRTGQGTALGDAVVQAIRVGQRTAANDAGGDAVPMVVLLLSDGRQDGGTVTPQRAAQVARQRGVPVYTVSLGTPDGVVQVPLAGGYTARVQVPPDPDSLRTLARTTGGRFFEAPASEDLTAVYGDLASRLGREPRRREVTVAFAAAGAMLLLVGGGLSTIWFRRMP